MGKELSYLEAIREALAEEMRRDPKVFVLGEDVGAYGGAFGVTQGLFEEFGETRVLDTPISESAIVGISIGAAMRGYRPVAEMQFADFISCAFDQIVNQAAALAREGVEVEVIDLRTLLPFDKNAIFTSVEKTSRALIVHEDVKTLGIGAELSAVIMEERFAHLDAPVLRLTYPDTHCPFSNILEQANLPDANK